MIIFICVCHSFIPTCILFPFMCLNIFCRWSENGNSTKRGSNCKILLLHLVTTLQQLQDESQSHALKLWYKFVAMSCNGELQSPANSHTCSSVMISGYRMTQRWGFCTQIISNNRHIAYWPLDLVDAENNNYVKVFFWNS